MTTPESVASRFSLVCSNDFQRSLSKVNCFVADLSMFKSYYYQLLSYSSQGIWQYVNVLVCLHGRKNDWRPWIWTSLRQVSYGPQPPSCGLCIFWTKTFLVKVFSFLLTLSGECPFQPRYGISHTKGRSPEKKLLLFLILSKLPPLPPPTPPIWTTCTTFFRRWNLIFESQFRTKNTIYTIYTT